MPKWNADLALDLIIKYVMVICFVIYLTFILRYQVTRASIIPTIVLQVLETARKRKLRLDSLLMVGSGAAYLSTQLQDQLVELAPNLSISQGGLDESCMSPTRLLM